jgi:membrane fusion protein, copper/silver efflux system
MKRINKIWILVPLALIIGIGAGVFLGKSGKEEHIHDEVVLNGETTWTCSMHPQIRQNEAGQCPICGMDLIPVDELTDEDNAYSVNLSSGAIRLGNVETTLVGTSGTPEETVTLNGRVVPDENQLRSQSTHVAGRIEQLVVNTEGEMVNRGQRIATLYSPRLIAAQQELLQAAAMKDSQPLLLEAAIEKLKSFRLSDAQINAILESENIRNTMDIYAEYGGTVLEKMVSIGDHVEEGTVLYTLSDLSRVWVEFDAYESDLPLLKIGDVIQFTVSGVPGKQFEGTISFIDPVVERRTRVASVRVEVRNPEGLLKPQMFATGSVQTTSGDSESDLVIPRSSVLWTGKRSVVYIKQSENASGGGSFQMQEIVLGPSIGNSYVVKDGLTKGDEIVTNGTFTVDAAAQLARKPSMMNTGMPSQDITTPGVVTEEISETVKPLVTAYLQLKDNLVKADLPSARENVKQMSVSLNIITFSDSKWQTWWNTHQKTIGQSLDAASSIATIDGLRKEFISLSESIVEVASAVSPLDDTLYIMHCPMANNNEGARWISLENEVRNPYYGEMMLTCGSITSTID